MHRRRIGFGIAVLAFAVMIAMKPDTGTLRLSVNTPGVSAPMKVEAAVEVGIVAISILVTKSRECP
jgi:hypothetical protein